MHRFVFGLIFAFIANAAGAGTPSQDDLERRVAALSKDLRCLVCQNQSLIDSQAELAIDLKNQVREKLAAGMSEQEAIDFLVARYGDFVLYRPPMKATTWLLWFGPLLLLVGGLAVLVVRLARPHAPHDVPPEQELRRAAALLDGTDQRPGNT